VKGRDHLCQNLQGFVLEELDWNLSSILEDERFMVRGGFMPRVIVDYVWQKALDLTWMSTLERKKRLPVQVFLAEQCRSVVNKVYDCQAEIFVPALARIPWHIHKIEADTRLDERSEYRTCVGLPWQSCHG